MMILEIFVALVALMLVAALRYRRKRETRPFEHTYVVITGCDTGFGRWAAERFDSLGMHVFAGCLLEKSIIELKAALSDRIRPVPLDVTKQTDIDTLKITVKREIPNGEGLTGLINNAGIFVACGFTESLGSEQFMSVFKVNFFGMVDVTKALLPLLRKGKGRIINTSSIVGKYGAPFIAPYCASKHAIESFTDSLRRELYHDGVSVHIIEPAGFKTKLLNSDKIEEESLTLFRTLPWESKEFYGLDLLKKINRRIKDIEEIQEVNINKVVDAYQHALTSSRPFIRYKVGKGSGVVLAMVNYLPDYWMDLCFSIGFPTAAEVKST